MSEFLDHWVQIDEDPPALYKLLIKGALDVINDPLSNFTLQAQYIIVDGIFNVGLETEPFLGEFTIALDGDSSLPDYGDTIDEEIDGPNVGNKAIGQKTKAMIYYKK